MSTRSMNRIGTITMRSFSSKKEEVLLPKELHAETIRSGIKAPYSRTLQGQVALLCTMGTHLKTTHDSFDAHVDAILALDEEELNDVFFQLQAETPKVVLTRIIESTNRPLEKKKARRKSKPEPVTKVPNKTSLMQLIKLYGKYKGLEGLMSLQNSLNKLIEKIQNDK